MSETRSGRGVYRAGDNAGAPLPRELEAARVTHLYRMALPAYVASPVYVVLLMFVLWNANTAEVLSAWFACILAASMARAAIHHAFLRAMRSGGEPDYAVWERRFVLGSLLVGAIWSVAPLLFFSAAPIVGQVAIIFVIGGALIGAAGLYAASRAAFLAFLALPLPASIYVLASQPGESYAAMAGMLLLFTVILYLVYAQLRRSILTALRNGLENESLLGRLGESETRLRDAIENAPDGIAVYDEADRLVTCNAEFATVYAPGKRPEELAGLPFSAMAESAFEHAEYVSEADSADRPGWIERRTARHLAADGTLRQYRTRSGRWLQGKTMRTPLGGIVSVFTDISETKRAEAAYQAVLAEENLVLDILPVGIAFVEHRTIMRCNRRLERMLGYAPGELVGKPTRALYSSDKSWSTVGQDTYTRMRNGAIIEDDTRMARKDGTPFWCHSLGSALDAGNPEASSIFAFSDAQDRRIAEAALRRSEAMYRNLVETSNDLIWSCDREGRWTYLNAQAVRRIWGGEPADLLGQSFSASLAPEVRERDLAVFMRILEGEHVHNYETRYLRRDGSAVDLSFNSIPLRSSGGRIVGATGTARDITDAKKAAAALYESVERLRLAVDAADLYYWEWDVASDKITWGRDPAGLLGTPDDASEAYRDFRTLVHPDDRERYFAEGRRILDNGGPYFCEFRVVRHDGQIHWLAARGRILYGEGGAAVRVIGVSQDVTERKRQEEEVRYLAYHDTLTGLPNRRLLDDRLQQVVYLAQRRDTKAAVMLIDLDRFKAVNDTLGHKAGDAVLREVANRLMGCVRKADTLARQGGDEFVIVIPELAAENDCAVVAEKILRTLSHDFHIGEHTLSIGASIGVSVFPADAGDGEALLRNADVAMYRAKELGRSNYRFYAK